MYDFLIVGTGVFGSVCARQLSDAGYRCLIVDKKSHIGGSCYTENIDGINVHKYGGHIIQTNNPHVWDYLKQFCDINDYVNRVKVNYKNKIYSFPVNLFTLNQLWGVTTPKEAKKILKEKRLSIKNPKNLEEYMLSQVGEEIYKTFIYGYSVKQWNTEPKNVPAHIGKRLSIRLNYNDKYFDKIYQGVPIGGYNPLFDNLIKQSDVILKVSDWRRYQNKAKNIIFTGSIDDFFDYKYGKLEYRSLLFKTKRINVEDYQGNAVINYTDVDVPYTRILEHKHFEFGKQKHTVISKEFPSSAGEPFYPINNERNNNLYKKYLNDVRGNNIYFGGRLGSYLYINIDEAVEMALNLSLKIKGAKT